MSGLALSPPGFCRLNHPRIIESSRASCAIRLRLIHYTTQDKGSVTNFKLCHIHALFACFYFNPQRSCEIPVPISSKLPADYTDQIDYNFGFLLPPTDQAVQNYLSTEYSPNLVLSQSLCASYIRSCTFSTVSGSSHLPKHSKHLPEPFGDCEVMSANRARRVAKELADIHADKLSNVTAHPVSHDDMMHLKGTFPGPPGTPYEGGKYTIDVRIPGDYPFRPPTMKFDTKVWHPNVSSQTVGFFSTSRGT